MQLDDRQWPIEEAALRESLEKAYARARSDVYDAEGRLQRGHLTRHQRRVLAGYVAAEADLRHFRDVRLASAGQMARHQHAVRFTTDSYPLL